LHPASDIVALTSFSLTTRRLGLDLPDFVAGTLNHAVTIGLHPFRKIAIEILDLGELAAGQFGAFGCNGLLLLEI
jgi:hypothetical protein